MLYISPLGCTEGSEQSYGSVPISERTPAPNFGGSGAVVLGRLGVRPLIFLCVRCSTVRAVQCRSAVFRRIQ